MSSRQGPTGILEPRSNYNYRVCRYAEKQKPQGAACKLQPPTNCLCFTRTGQSLQVQDCCTVCGEGKVPTVAVTPRFRGGGGGTVTSVVQQNVLSGNIVLGHTLSSPNRDGAHGAIPQQELFSEQTHSQGKGSSNPTTTRVEARGSRAAELTCSVLSPHPPDRLSSTLTIHIFSKSTTNPFRLFLFATFLTWPRSKVGDFYGAKGRTQNRCERQKGALMERVKTFPSEQRHPLIHQNIMVVLEQSHATAWGTLHSGNTSPRGCWAWHAPRS